MIALNNDRLAVVLAVLRSPKISVTANQQGRRQPLDQGDEGSVFHTWRTLEL
jgi:hypothetical protein